MESKLCTKTKRAGFDNYVCEKCNGSWFESTGAPFCFAPTVPEYKHPEKVLSLEEEIAKLRKADELEAEEWKKTLDWEREMAHVDAVMMNK